MTYRAHCDNYLFTLIGVWSCHRTAEEWADTGTSRRETKNAQWRNKTASSSKEMRGNPSEGRPWLCSSWKWQQPIHCLIFLFFWSEPSTRTSWQGSAMMNRCDSRYGTFISNPATSCVGAFWSQSGGWNRALARRLVLGAVTFICTICFWHRQHWPGRSKVRSENKATESMGLRVQIWEMGRGRMHFNLSTSSLNTFVVFKLIQIPTWPKFL